MTAGRPAARRVGIVGGGAIGVAFALLLADHGWDVRLVEQDAGRHPGAAEELRTRTQALVDHGTARSSVRDVADRVSITADLAAGLAGVELILECISESVPAKQALVAAVAELVEAGAVAGDVVVASASSSITPSQTFADSPLAARGLVAHPLNPPYAIPLVEIVPGPATAPDAVDTARGIFRSVGMEPITLNHEVPGFVTNRLQAALLREAYLLVRDGVASPEDIDTAVSAGLGRRWAVLGPFDVADLNTRGGLAAHSERLGGAYGTIVRDRGTDDPWSDADLLARVAADLRARRPLPDWEPATRRRDDAVLDVGAALAPADQEAEQS